MKKLLIAALVAVLLIAIAYSGMAIYFQSINPAEWFKVPPLPGKIVVDDDSRLSRIYDETGEIMLFSQISLQESESVTVRLTGLPETDNREVIWESDCDDIGVVPSKNDSRVATIYHLIGQWAECTAKITCRAADDNEVLAVCNVKKLAAQEAVRLEAGIHGPSTIKFDTAYDIKYSLEPAIPFPGVIGYIEDMWIWINLKPEFIQLINRYLETEFLDTEFEVKGTGFKLPSSPWEAFCGNKDEVDEEAFNRAFNFAVKGGSVTEMCTLTIDASYFYAGVSIGGRGEMWVCDFDVSDIFTDEATEKYSISYDQLGSGSVLCLDFKCVDSAEPGETVTFTVRLVDLEDCEPVAIIHIILRSGIDEIDLGEGEGTFSFVMPHDDVTIVFYTMSPD